MKITHVQINRWTDGAPRRRYIIGKLELMHRFQQQVRTPATFTISHLYWYISEENQYLAEPSVGVE